MGRCRISYILFLLLLCLSITGCGNKKTSQSTEITTSTSEEQTVVPTTDSGTTDASDDSTASDETSSTDTGTSSQSPETSADTSSNETTTVYVASPYDGDYLYSADNQTSGYGARITGYGQSGMRLVLWSYDTDPKVHLTEISEDYTVDQITAGTFNGSWPADGSEVTFTIHFIRGSMALSFSDKPAKTYTLIRQ